MMFEPTVEVVFGHYLIGFRLTDNNNQITITVLDKTTHDYYMGRLSNTSYLLKNHDIFYTVSILKEILFEGLSATTWGNGGNVENGKTVEKMDHKGNIRITLNHMDTNLLIVSILVDNYEMYYKDYMSDQIILPLKKMVTPLMKPHIHEKDIPFEKLTFLQLLSLTEKIAC